MRPHSANPRPFNAPVLRSVLVLALLAASAVAVSPAAATAIPPAVRRIDAQIDRGEQRIATWNDRLVRWQLRVGRAAGRVQRLSYREVYKPQPASIDALRTGTSRSVTGRDPLREAHRRLQALLRDHRAQEAMQQILAWQSYIVRLQSGRAEARAAAEARSDDRERLLREMSRGPVTYDAWAQAFLSAVGAPACDENRLLLVTWETAESTQALYNPLATTHEMKGASAINDVGVKSYVSLEQGVVASRDTLQGGAASFGYEAVLAALRACAPADTTAAAIRDSAWCRECARGAYVTGMLAVVRSQWGEHARRLVATAG